MTLAAIHNKPAVLTSWKEIANYMGKGVRTVQRWEQDFGLPVRRPQGSNKKAILARPRDLDAWVALRCSSRADGAPAPAVSPHRLGALASLSGCIATSRQLQQDNRVLMSEVHSALDKLRDQILSLQAGR